MYVYVLIYFLKSHKNSNVKDNRQEWFVFSFTVRLIVFPVELFQNCVRMRVWRKFHSPVETWGKMYSQ